MRVSGKDVGLETLPLHMGCVSLNGVFVRLLPTGSGWWVWGGGRSGPGQLGEPQGRSPGPECSLPRQLPTRHKEAFMGWCGEN